MLEITEKEIFSDFQWIFYTELFWIGVYLGYVILRDYKILNIWYLVIETRKLL